MTDEMKLSKRAITKDPRLSQPLSPDSQNLAFFGETEVSACGL